MFVLVGNVVLRNGMEIKKIQSTDGTEIIKLVGRLDLQGVGEIEDEFKGIYSEATGCLVVDMAEVAFLASLGMRLLMMAAKSLSQRGGSIIVVEPQEVVENALRMSGLDQVIGIVDSLSEL